MRALTVIAECGGVTRAAKRLNLSQSAVSHKMKRLEGRLNRNLFTRIDGKLVFSADGEKLLDYARRLVRLHDEACASFHQSDLAGELRLGITEDVSAPGMAHILSSFSTSFPNVALTSRVAPELTEWSERFSAVTGQRVGVETGLVRVSAREADDLLRDAETFVDLAAARLGLPSAHRPRRLVPVRTA